jgi:hypothetical protein
VGVKEIRLDRQDPAD